MNGEDVVYEQPPMGRPSSSFRYEEMPERISPEVWASILDRQTAIENLMRAMAGDKLSYVVDKEGTMQPKWENVGKPLLNKEGRDTLSTFILTAGSVNTIMTNLTEDEVRIRADKFRAEVILLLTEKWREWGMDDSSRSLTTLLLDEFYYTNLTASRRGTLLEVLKPTYKRVESQQMQKRPGRLRWPGFLGGRR